MSEAMPTVPWSPSNNAANAPDATDATDANNATDVTRATDADDSSLLADPALRKDVAAYVRRRVPARDVDDVVQSVLCAALGMPRRPKDPRALRRWVLGMAQHKVVDVHRHAEHEPRALVGEVLAGPPPLEERELVRWAEKQAGPTGEAQKTLAWMAREGEGEKLESIAEDEQLPATRVRQRVSRMRRWMKQQWMAELAAVAALTIVAWWLLRGADPKMLSHDHPAPSISSEPPDLATRARLLRRDALAACDRGAWRACLDTLDEAKSINPMGDAVPTVGTARRMAETGLGIEAPVPTDAPVPSASPALTKKQVAPKAAPKPAPFSGAKAAPTAPQPTRGKKMPGSPKSAATPGIDPGAIDLDVK